MLKRHASLMLIAILVMTTVIPATAQVTRPPVVAPSSGLIVPVTGHTRPGGRVNGTFTVVHFKDVGGQIHAIGKLVLPTRNGLITTTASLPVTLPSSVRVTSAGDATNAVAGLRIQQVQACTVLELVLGPLDLNLLGLEVHLDTVHLLIEANPALGLLGQILAILCQPGGNPLATIIDLLNEILDALNAINSL